MSTLPTPSADAIVQSKALAHIIRSEIMAYDGWIDFAQFMQMALYTPHLGYYSGGSKKFGQEGDFVTAPEITPLFAQTLARQVSQILSYLDNADILEIGAGTGNLAADLLLALAKLHQLPQFYYILEVSNHLRFIQQETLEKQLPVELMQKIVWLDTLPETFIGVVLGNEVLDAIPVHLVVHTQQGLYERGISSQDDELIWHDKPIINDGLINLVKEYELPQDYLTEFCPAANGLIASLAGILQQGAIIMIDYGFSALEYYHPQRNQGSLMCHYQHYAHSNPLIYLGLQDITAHVNFTAIAQTALDKGLQVAGFATQAQFLINCGITELLHQVPADDVSQYLPLVTAAQKLISPAEMGDLFKVIALTKDLPSPLIGFAQGDRRHTL